MLVSDKEITVLVDGSGNCIEIEKGVVAIGSGGLYAQGFAHLPADLFAQVQIIPMADAIALIPQPEE